MSPSGFHLAMLRSASLLVGEQQRAEWLAEWTSELWHAHHEPHGANITAFCVGAFRDAFWLRRNAQLPRSYGVYHLDIPAEPAIEQNIPEFGAPFLASPARCLSVLGGLAAVTILIAFLLPTSRALIMPASHPDRGLVMLTSANMGDAGFSNGLVTPFPSVSVDQFRSLQRRVEVAFYLPTGMQVGRTKLTIARTSTGLFQLLGVSVPQAGKNGASLLLMGDSPMVGHTVNVSGHPVLVSGTLSASKWILPGQVDGWLLDDDAALAALPARTAGFAVARRPGKLPGYTTMSLADRSHRWPLFRMLLFEFFFGCALVRVGTPFSLGEYHQRWLFLGTKIALILPIVVFGALDLACFGGMILEPALFLAMLGGWFAMRWALADQRGRCPVCLRLLANPVRIGHSSRILLEWHGTELVCLRGHGLLHIPERPAIWFSAQRWMELDSSWSGLFTEATPTVGRP